MDGGGTRNFGRRGGGRRGGYQNQRGRAHGNGQIPNRGGGSGLYTHRQPPSQGRWNNPPHQARGYRPPQALERHQIGGRAGACRSSRPPTPLYRPPLPPQPSADLLSKVVGSRRNNSQRGSCRGGRGGGGRGGGGRRYPHNQHNKGNGRWRDSPQHCCSCGLNLNQLPPVTPDQTISKQGKLDVDLASGTGVGRGALAPPAEPGDHMNRVFGTWSRTWKPLLLPLEWRADLSVSFGWKLNWR